MLGWIWHNHHFTLITPPPPTRNSTSTRKNDPRGLKFCRWLHLTKLKTIKFFEQKIYFYQKNIGHISCDQFNFFDQKPFSNKSFLTKIFLNTKFFPKSFLKIICLTFFDKILFCEQQFFSLEIFFDQQFC